MMVSLQKKLQMWGTSDPFSLSTVGVLTAGDGGDPTQGWLTCGLFSFGLLGSLSSLCLPHGHGGRVGKRMVWPEVQRRTEPQGPIIGGGTVNEAGKVLGYSGYIQRCEGSLFLYVCVS